MAPVKKSLFDTLIDLNDKFHEYAADLITTAKIQEDVAEISMDILNKVMAASGEGTAALATDPKLKNYYTQFNLWSQAPSNILVFYKPKPTDKTVTIPESVFKDLLDPVLNQMANLVHNAAIDSIGPTKQLKNCKVANLQPDNAIPVGKYCSGAKNSVQVTVAPESKFKVGNKTFVQNYPQLLIQPLGVHKVMPSVYKAGDEIKMAVEYHDSYLNHTGSANRLRGTRERLEMLGFQCNLGKTANGKYKQVKDIYCNIDDIAPNTIRELATFFSLLLNGDIADSIQQNDEMYPVIRDKAWEKAVEYNAKYGDNTWESPVPHQLDWDKLAKEWKQENQFTKNPLYNDLRQLLYLRDIHHMIEEKYGTPISGHKSTVTEMKMLYENGLKIQAILSKNSWGSVSSNISHIKQLIDIGKPADISGTGGLSDQLGNHTHGIATDILNKSADYGGCIAPFGGNISAGNLAYCEGILAGSNGKPINQTGGNGWIHTSNPNKFSINIGEEHYPDFEYSLKVTPSDLSPFWAKEVQKALNEKFHFNCAGKTCTLPTENHDVIRQVAAFLSNLRGADEKVGEECAKKAIQDAYEASNNLKQKGVFTFAQNSIFNYPKEWVDKCFKQYGITPVGMSKEEEMILKLIGADKIYGGCSFENSDILPDLGFIKYCSGVRYNPQGKTNAYIDPSGVTLEQYFHGTTDKIAGINVEIESPGKYAVTIGGFNLHDKIAEKPLQTAVVNRLKSIGLTCPSLETCATKKPINEQELRLIATYLSSFHQAYQLPADCIPKVEKFVFDTATKLSTNPEAYKITAHPHYKAEWENEVCAKGIQPTVKTEAKPASNFEETLLTLIKKYPNYNGGNLFELFQAKHPGAAGSVFVAAIKALVDKNLIKASSDAYTDVNTIYNAVEEKLEPVTPVAPVTKYSYGLVAEHIGVKHDKPGFKVGACVSHSKVAPSGVKAAYCLGIPQYAKVIGVGEISTIPGQIAAIYPDGDGYHHINGINSPVIFTGSGKTLFISLPAELQHPQVKKYLVDDLKFTPQSSISGGTGSTASGGTGWTFSKEKYMSSMFKAAHFLSQLTYFGELDEECKATAIKKAALIASSGQHYFIYPYTLKDWKEFCATGQPTGKKTFQNIAELNSFILGIFKKEPAVIFGKNEIKSKITEAGYEIPIPNILDNTIIALVSNLKIEPTGAPNHWTLAKEEEVEPPWLKEPWKLADKGPIGLLLENVHTNPMAKKVAECMAKELKVFLGGKLFPANEYYLVNMDFAIASTGLSEETLKGTWKLCYEKITGKKPLNQFSDSELMAMVDFICSAKKAGNTIGQVQGLFYEAYHTPVTGDTNTWIVHQYDKCVTTEKPPLGLTQMKGFILDYLFNHHKSTYTEEGLLQSITEAGYQPSIGGMIHKALEELVKGKKIITEIEHGVQVFKWVPLEATEEQALDDKIVAAILEHIKENLKLQQEWNSKGQLWKNEAQDKDAYKKLPKLSQDIIHNLMDLYLLTAYKEHKPYDQVVKELQGNIIKLYPKLTPLMVKLQTDLEKKVKINKGLLPECDEKKCELKATSYETMSKEEQEAVKEELKELISSGSLWDKAAEKVAEKFGIGVDSSLEGLAQGVAQKLAIESQTPIEEVKELHPWSDIGKIQQEAFAKKVTEEKVVGWDELKQAAETFGIIPDEDELPSILELKQMAEEEEAKAEEEPNTNYEDLTMQTQQAVDADINFLVEAEHTYATIANEIAHKWKLNFTPGLEKAIKLQMGIEEKQPEALIQEEAMSHFIKQGMDAHAIQILFAGGTYPQTKLKSTSEKLYKLYHPDLEVMTIPWSQVPLWIVKKITSLAETMLSQGKTQEDTTWYIAYHFHIDKAGVKEMVNSVAKLPVVKQKQLLETTIKILQVGEKLAGCEVGDEDMENVTASTVAYCQGVIHPMIIPEDEAPAKAITDEHGIKVNHATWTQLTILKTDVKNGGRTNLSYEPAIEEDNPNYHPEKRSDELNRILGELGFLCESGEKGKIDCSYALSSDLNLPINDQDNIRKAALLISGIDKIAALPVSCIPKAMEYAKNHAIGINKTSKPWTVPVYPETVDEWMKNVCEKVTV